VIRHFREDFRTFSPSCLCRSCIFPTLPKPPPSPGLATCRVRWCHLGKSVGVGPEEPVGRSGLTPGGALFVGILQDKDTIGRDAWTCCPMDALVAGKYNNNTLYARLTKPILNLICCNVLKCVLIFYSQARSSQLQYCDWFFVPSATFVGGKPIRRATGWSV